MSTKKRTRVSVLANGRMAAIARRQLATAQRRIKKFSEPTWLGLEAYFDPTEIEMTPIKDAGFMLGAIDDLIVVEMPRTASDAQVSNVGMQMTALGMKVLVIREGVSFLRLREITGAEAEKLSAIAALRAEREAALGDADADTNH